MHDRQREEEDRTIESKSGRIAEEANKLAKARGVEAAADLFAEQFKHGLDSLFTRQSEINIRMLDLAQNSDQKLINEAVELAHTQSVAARILMNYMDKLNPDLRDEVLNTFKSRYPAYESLSENVPLYSQWKDIMERYVIHADMTITRAQSDKIGRVSEKEVYDHQEVLKQSRPKQEEEPQIVKPARPARVHTPNSALITASLRNASGQSSRSASASPVKPDELFAGKLKSTLDSLFTRQSEINIMVLELASKSDDNLKNQLETKINAQLSAVAKLTDNINKLNPELRAAVFNAFKAKNPAYKEFSPDVPLEKQMHEIIERYAIHAELTRGRLTNVGVDKLMPVSVNEVYNKQTGGGSQKSAAKTGGELTQDMSLIEKTAAQTDSMDSSRRATPVRANFSGAFGVFAKSDAGGGDREKEQADMANRKQQSVK